MEKKFSFIVNIVYYLLLTAIVFFVVRYVLPVLTPFVLGFLIAYVLRRPTCYVSNKFRLPQKPVSLVLVLLFYGTIGLLITLLVLKAISGVESLVAFIPTFYQSSIVPMVTDTFNGIENFVQELNPSLVEWISGFGDQVMQALGDMISKLSSWAVATASGFAASIPGIFIKIVLMIISSFFIASDYETLTGFCIRQLSESQKALFHQIHEYIIGTLWVCIRSYAIIMSLTFVELSIGLTLFGINYPVLIAALIAVFDILPVLGTGGIMVPWAVITLLSGKYLLSLGLLLLYVAITVVRNIVEPKIVGKQLGLHPVVTLISMFVGLQLLGVIGMFGFPILISLLRYLQNNGTIHIFK